MSLYFSALAASGYKHIRLLQLVYVIEDLILFTSADHRNHPKFGFFLRRYSEHPESFEGWQVRAIKQLCSSYFLWNPGPSMSKEQTEKYFSRVEKDQSTLIFSQQKQQKYYFLVSQSRIFSQLSSLKGENVMFCNVKISVDKDCHICKEKMNTTKLVKPPGMILEK